MKLTSLWRPAGILVGLAIVSTLAPMHGARAAWPPAPNADFTDPANFPNDPNYKDRWNYWSFLPPQDKGTSPYLGADQKLGASGMSVDKAWALTIGRPDVRIAVLDSGIEWEAADVANKTWLNAKELSGTAKPQDKNGAACGGTGELAGYDCNGDGVFSVADYRDDPRISPVVTGEKCNPGMDPQKPGPNDRIKGDANRNCILDAGDLIELFSDGVDDDGNGYVDDISGWDFYRNDNNAYDDTRYGHGTGEARDSSAEGNNGIDTIGTCPKCTFLPLRVGESFIADANDFAKAVVYATDMGVKVVQEALGTLNQTAFSKAAIDYAYEHGTMIDASMADENSRHHNMPATANHTLPVHTIRYNGDNYRNSTTFLAYDTCTNYGGHGALSVSGTSCASEATGRMAGIAGLVYSMGLSLPTPLNLSAEEVMQVLKMSADDVDVPESRVVNPDTGLAPFFESKPGWDQRFNYGRTNAFKAVTMVKEGRIPPEVDIVSPTWYQPIYANRTNGPVAIFGRVAATRASSYDYVVEWGPGVQPADDEFKPLMTEVKNVPAGTITGGQVPLASFDPKQLDTKHVLDADSKPICNRDKTHCWSPNDRTITLRVRSVAHYGAGDVRGEARRTIAITNALNGDDPDLLPGFPIDLGSSGEGNTKLADLDGDGVRDVIFPSSDGTIHAWNVRGGEPKEIAGWPIKTAVIDGLNPAITDPFVPSYLKGTAYKNGKNGGIDTALAHEAIMNAPAVDDLDGDGKPEVVLSTWPGTIYVVDRSGKALPGWPKRLPLVPSCPLDPSKPKPAGDCMDLRHSYSRGTYAAPVLADMDKDGKLDIIQTAFDGNIYVFHADGTPVAGWPVRVHFTRQSGNTTLEPDKANRIMTTPAVADINKDGFPEIITGSNEEFGGGGNTGPMFVVDGRGTNAPTPYLPNWPILRPSIHLFPVVAEGLNASPAIADFDGDGTIDVAIQGNGSPPLLVKSDPGAQGQFEDPPNVLPQRSDGKGFEATAIFGEKSLAKSDVMFPLFSVPAIGDLDQDGTPDLIMSGGSLSLIGSLAGGGKPSNSQHLLAAWSGKTGAMLPGMPVLLEDFQFLINHAVADLNGDDYPEVITGSGVYFVHAADACGREPAGWPKFTNGWVASSPAIGDVTGDGNVDVVTATRNGFLFIWKTTSSDKGVINWESFHHDNRNTGNFSTPLDQGVVKRAAAVIDCTLPTAPTPDGLVAGGGCDCNTTAGRGQEGVVYGIAGLLGLLVWKRRRRS
jgi:hypothetical protein